MTDIRPRVNAKWGVDPPKEVIMEEIERAWFWLSLDGDTPDDDESRLIEMLTDQENGIRVEPTGAGPGLGDIVLGVTVYATATVTLANHLLELARKLGRFRKEQQQHGKPGRIRIERSNGDKVEIEGYTAQEILPMLTAAMYTPQHEDPQEPDHKALPDAAKD